MSAGGRSTTGSRASISRDPRPGTSPHAALGAAERLGEPVAQAHNHRSLAWSDTRLGRFEDSRSHLLRALELSAEVGDLIGQAATFHSLAVLADRQRHYAEALDHARQFLKLFKAAGSGVGVARGLNSLGWYHAQLGEYSEALDFCEQALNACQELESGHRRHLEAAIWDSFGFIHHRLGNHERAGCYYRQTLQRNRELGERLAEGETLSSLGDLHLSSGDPDSAREAWQEALDILSDLEHPSAAEVQEKLARRSAWTSLSRRIGSP